MQDVLLISYIVYRDLGVRKRDLVDNVGYGVALSHIGLEELHARGDVIEQVAHDEGCAVGTAGVREADLLAALDDTASADILLFCLGDELEMGYGGDGRESLASKAEGGYGVEVALGCDLGGGMTNERRADILAQDTAAVIGHAHEGDAAVLYLDGDGCSACVDSVLDQLFDDRRGALDDLAGCNQLGCMLIKYIDPAHEEPPFL